MSLRTRRGVSFSTKAAAALAALSVVVAAWLSLQPHRLGDLYRLVGWTSQWLSGAHIYGPISDVDYPPWAIVTLSPLALVPVSLLPFVWGGSNLLALVFVARRLAGSRRTMFYLLIAAGTMRTLNQFSLVALALAVAGATANESRSWLWLGLSLMKPQIGLVFWLHALWQRRWPLAARAAVVPLLLTGVYAWRAHVSPLSVPAAYAQSIALQYGDILWGQTEWTSGLRTIWPAIPAALLAVGIALIVWAPVARWRPPFGFAMASLLAMRHMSYDLILLLPTVATLDGAALWSAVLLMMGDPSALAGVFLSPDTAIIRHADRFVLGGIWCVGVILAARFRSVSRTKRHP